MRWGNQIWNCGSALRHIFFGPPRSFGDLSQLVLDLVLLDLLKLLSLHPLLLLSSPLLHGLKEPINLLLPLFMLLLQLLLLQALHCVLLDPFECPSFKAPLPVYLSCLFFD